MARARAEWVAHLPMDGFHLADAQLRRLGPAGPQGGPGDLRRVGLRPPAPPGPGQPRGGDLGPRLRARPRAATRRRPGGVSGRPARGHRGQLPPPRRAALAQGPSRAHEVWYVTTDNDARISRLIARHVEFGKSPDAAAEWVTTSDEKNAQLVAATSSRADRVVVNAPHGWQTTG